jgi:uncharacterized RDD family membrane protein YckC
VAEPAGARTVDVLATDGTVLPFEQAGLVERCAALCVDQVIIFAATGIMVLGALLVLGGALGIHVLSLMIVINFVLRNAYFSFFEVRGGGATPGKHWLRLRVISRDGGALQPEQVLVRNLTREFEVFVPMSVLAAPQGMFPDLPPWAGALCSLWLLVGALFPFFNPRRFRLGDLLGGTIVVSMPRIELRPELVAAPVERRSQPTTDTEYEFTSVQLGQYGIDQLQVLEDLLRVDDEFEHKETLVAVLRRVEAKIGWDTPTPEARAGEFLAAFYAQLRRHLEQKALFGVRQQHKREGRLERGGRSEPPT